MPAVGALVRSTNGMWIAQPVRPRWIALAIRNFHNSGNTTTMRGPLAVVAAFFTGSDATHRRPPSSGSRSIPGPAAEIPEIAATITHLRDVLGEQAHESLAREGETMTAAAIAAYAYDQIDQARTKLNTVGK
jgi:hypothetical protein